MTTPGTTDELDDSFLELQQDYIREAPARLAELRKDLAAFRAGEPDALESLRQRFHRLAGSGGSYGFQRVTDIARAMEHRILTPPAPTVRDAELFDQALRDLKEAFDAAATDVGLPAILGRIPDFGWRALLVMSASPTRDTLVQALGEVGFDVAVREGSVDPWEVPPTERPDLVVIGADGEVDPLSLARFWSAATTDRPRAVVLADPHDAFDRLRTAAAGLDAVFGSAAIPAGLAQYARALAQVGAPPANILVVEDDPAQAQLFATWLGQLNARVTIAESAQVARESLTRETPDLVLLDVDLPDVDGYAISRLMRQDQRLSLVPIVFLTARQSLADQMEGLRAGGDDFLAKPVERQHLIQLALTRTERGRRIRELVHRDGLTGVLNHATLMAELEHAIAYASRHGEPICFLMLDIDHFKRINDTYGHLIGDQVLMHVAHLFRRAIRGADVIGRYGGEEFGIILRKCPPANGRAAADKLRQLLASTPVVIPSGEGIELHLHVSIGVGAYPSSGRTATEVVSAADRAMYLAKRTGRNRVEMG